MLRRLLPREVSLSSATRAARRATLLVFFASCGDPAGVSDNAGAGVVRFVVSNQLAAPVTIAIDDTVADVLLGGASSGLAVSPSAQWLTWTSAKPTDATGMPIPDDIGAVRLRVREIRFALEIANVINDTTYVSAELFNTTNARVSIGVYDGSTVACAGVLRATVGGVVGFTKIGYYRLLPRTEIRAYRDEFSCTGPYYAWPTSQLMQFEPKSGLVTLTLASPP